ELQPDRGRRQPGAVAAADALPDGAARHHRVRIVRALLMTEDWDGGWWRGATRIPSPNFSARPAGARVDTVVLHSISLPPGQYGGDGIQRLFTNTLDWSAHPYYDSIRGLEVSAHFVVRRDGQVMQFVSIDER